MVLARRETTAVTFFEELYAIVVGLGLALALEQTVDLEREGFPVAAEHIPLFLAYLNLAFALAHASVRYLQLAYVERSLGRLGRGRVIADLVLGVGHFLWLMALSFLITRPVAFAIAAIVLLAGRPLRDTVLALTKMAYLPFDRTVAGVHVVTIVVLFLTISIAAMTGAGSGGWTVRIGALVASLVFGLGMYLFAFPYFFPFDDEVAAT